MMRFHLPQKMLVGCFSIHVCLGVEKPNECCLCESQCFVLRGTGGPATEWSWGIPKSRCLTMAFQDRLVDFICGWPEEATFLFFWCVYFVQKRHTEEHTSSDM